MVQELLGRSHVLVIGAGALGNEVVKNLALLGVGHVAVRRYRTRSRPAISAVRCFFGRGTGEGQGGVRGLGSAGNLSGDGKSLLCSGMCSRMWGWVTFGGRMWLLARSGQPRGAGVRQRCVRGRVGRPWFDGGIEVLHGVVRGFSAPRTACYECTISQVDWELLNKRRSCSLLARRAAVQRGTPTTPTTGLGYRSHAGCGSGR